MKALVLTDHQNLEEENIEIGPLANKQVKVKVHRAGICGTDLKLFQGKYFKKPGEMKEIILGHEFIGTISEVGKEVKKFKIGDRVSAHATMETCGDCRYCEKGEFNLCELKERVGFNFHGVFAENVILNENQLYIIPHEITEKAAVLIEPISVVARAISKANIRPTDSILITGPGTIGLLTLIVAKKFGAKVTVTGIEKDKERLELAKELGADQVFTTSEKRIDKMIFDIAFECSGHEDAINLALQTLKPKGQYVQVGTSSNKVNIDFMKIAYKEIKVTGSIGAVKEDWYMAIELLKEIQFTALKIIGQEIGLNDWRKGFENFGNTAKHPKTVFLIN